MVANLLSIRATKENLELARELQQEMNAHFLVNTMYDVNDALASILALCDMEQVSSLPQVKKYINRVNKLLDDVKAYQDDSVFNLNHVLKNVMDVIKSKFKSKVNVDYRFSVNDALIKGEKIRLEQILLYILIEFATATGTGELSEISLDLSQKEKDASVRISRSDFALSQHALQELSQMRDNFKGLIKMTNENNRVEIEIYLPMYFKVVNNEASIQVGGIKLLNKLAQAPEAATV